MPSDEKIKRDIVDQLYWDGRVDASDIHVAIADGNVVLRGTVPTYGASKAAETGAWTVSGVRSVDNNIAVKHKGSLRIPTDQEIRKDIEMILDWNPDIDAVGIKISVDGGEVILEGSVSSYWEKKRAEDLCGLIVGVREITNSLLVVPSESVLDQAIADGIAKALARNPHIDADSIDIRVRDGVVTLSGSVPNRTAFEAAQEAAQYSLGVVEIYNKLKIS